MPFWDGFQAFVKGWRLDSLGKALQAFVKGLCLISRFGEGLSGPDKGLRLTRREIILLVLLYPPEFTCFYNKLSDSLARFSSF